MWRKLRTELLACLTLQPELADGEQYSSSVAPQSGASGRAAAKLLFSSALGLDDPLGATISRKQPQKLAVLFSSAAERGGGAKDACDYVASEAKARNLAAVSARPLEAAPPVENLRAAVIVCSASAGASALSDAEAWLEGTAPGQLKGLSFVVLGVGDSASADMQAPRVLRQRLLAAGAAEMAAMAECNEAEIGEVLELWAASLWDPLQKALQPPSDDGIKAITAGLFQQLGGGAGLSSIFQAWLRKAQADWRVRRFLEGAADEAVKADMGQWLAATLGGPLPYRGPDPAALYSKLTTEKGLNGTHLDTLCQHLAGSMSELGVTADTIDGALKAIAYQRQLLS